jgi:hypothetical protein
VLSAPIRGRFYWILFVGLLATSFVALVVADRGAPGGRGIVKIAGVDPPCYFGIAHSLLFRHDFDLTSELRVFPSADPKWITIQPATGLPGSPYAIGYSLLSLPFLAAGTLVDGATGSAADGYGRYALLFYFFANITFTLAGLFLLVDLLILVFAREKMARRAVSVSVAATFFGTSLLVYSFSPMAHAASFLCAAAFVSVWYRVRDSSSLPGWALVGFIGGLLAITRWQDSVFLAAPVIFDLFRWRSRVPVLTRWLASRALGAAAFALCWIPQAMEWKSIYGRFLLVPQGAGFIQWPPVHFFPVLFSSSHGWFIWTPVAMIGVAGMLFGLTRSWTLALPWLIVLLAEVTIMGCLRTSWDGTDSFSIRPLTSCLPLIAIGVCALLTQPIQAMRRTCAALTGISVLYTLAFAAQFRLDMIPRKGPLTMAELFGDKLFFGRAYARRTAHNRVTALMQNRDYRQAETAAKQAIENYQEDRFLLADLQDASIGAGDPAEAAIARGRLNRMLDHRLY